MKNAKQGNVTLRPARVEDAAAMSDLALRSKGHWPYSADFLEACRGELTYTANDIESETFHFVVAQRGDSLCAFYGLSVVAQSVAEIEALFVDPDCIGQGLGGQLWRHAVALAHDIGITTITIQSDPYAEPFYAAMGAVTTGSKPSGSVPGRVLPLMRFSVPVPAA
ncbi:MAG: GNAT family N-acetyltransferase [Gammaproteobacteria bacterium]